MPVVYHLYTFTVKYLTAQRWSVKKSVEEEIFARTC